MDIGDQYWKWLSLFNGNMAIVQKNTHTHTHTHTHYSNYYFNKNNNKNNDTILKDTLLYY